jgi:hypothetical protein
VPSCPAAKMPVRPTAQGSVIMRARFRRAHLTRLVVRAEGKTSSSCREARCVPSHTTVARAEGCTCGAKVWALSIVQGPFSVAPCQNLSVTIRNLFSAVWWRLSHLGRALHARVASHLVQAAVDVVGRAAVGVVHVVLRHDAPAVVSHRAATKRVRECCRPHPSLLSHISQM